MKKQEIIDTLKSQYNRDIRKQLVRTLIDAEKENDTLSSYKLINQIFSYVLAELGWSMADNTKNWDNSPLEIMKEVFPRITDTQWFKEQQLLTDRSINVQMDDIE